MAINNVGGMKQVLDTYNAKDWIKSAELKQSGLNLKDSPVSTAENGNVQQTFKDFLVDSLNRVNEAQSEANKAMEKLATGKSKNIHETMLMVEQADIAFKTMNQVRLKVLDAYKEVMRMQV